MSGDSSFSWRMRAREKMKEKATVEEVKDEIEKREPSLRKVKDYIEAHPIMDRGIVSQNIQGFIGYFKYKERQHL